MRKGASVHLTPAGTLLDKAVHGLSKARKNRQQHILDHAAKLFSHRGYEGTSMRDVAAAVGMLHGSLYYLSLPKTSSAGFAAQNRIAS